MTYTIQAISKTNLKEGIVSLSGTNISVKTKQTNIKQARLVPKNNYYVVEIIYEKEVEYKKVDKQKIAGIDLGINNLATVTSNQKGLIPILINGRPLKSMNQYYNKKKSILQSCIGNTTSKKIKKLTNKRNFKIDDYMHKSSRLLVDYLIENEIGTLVIGSNKYWKTECNLGKSNNQKFIQIPHSRFIEMVSYKCEMVGIETIIQEESYTSKCSFIDNESIEKHETYLGRRIKRGLFLSKKCIKINADCNGSGNIIRKAIPNAFADGTEGVVVRPLRVSPKGYYTYKKDR